MNKHKNILQKTAIILSLLPVQVLLPSEQFKMATKITGLQMQKKVFVSLLQSH